MDFVYDGTSLPYPKVDGISPPGGYSADEWVLAGDWNPVCQAIVDVRTAVLNGKYHGLLPVSSDSAFHSASQPYVYYKTDNTLWLHKGDDSYYEITGRVPTSRTVTAGTGLSGGGDLSANRTLGLADTAVTPGSYTYASITVDQQGRITAASNGGGTLTSPTLQGTVSKGTGLILPDLAFSGSVNSAELLTLTNTNALGLSAILMKDSSGTSRVSFGYGNASYTDTDLRLAFAYLQSTDFSITDATTHFVYVDRANVRVGINTNAPSHALDIRKNLTADHVIRVENDSTSGFCGIVFYDSSGANKGSLGYANSAANLSGSYGSSSMFISPNTGVKLNFISSNTGGSVAAITNVSSSGYSQLDFADTSGSTVKTAVGYANGSTGGARQSRSFVWIGTDLTITDDTTHFIYVDKANSRIGMLAAGTSPALALDIRSSVSGANLVRVQNTHASGFSAVTAYDSSGTAQGSFGYGNSSTSAPWTSILYISLGTPNFMISDGTSTLAYVDRANARWGFGDSSTTPGATLEVKPKVVSSGTPVGLLVTGVLHTNLTAGADIKDVYLSLNRVLQRATGSVTLHDSVLIDAPTLGFVGASTVTDASVVGINDYVKAGTNATITTSSVIRVAPSFAPTTGATKFIGVNVSPTINQTGSASGDYTALHVNVTETATLGTNKFLLDLQTGGNSRLRVNSDGAWKTIAANLTTATAAEYVDMAFDISRTLTFSDTGTLAVCRQVNIQHGTYAASTSKTITDAITFNINGPPTQGANITLTNVWAFSVQTGNSRFLGDVYVGTSNVFHVAVDGKIGMYGVSPVSRATVTGSRGANAALASLLTALAATGIIVDSSS